MLRKINRVSSKDVDLIFKIGRFITSPYFTFKFIINNDKNRKISFICPKNVAKLAVRRNLLRRRGYTAMAKYVDLFPLGVCGVFIFKKYQDDLLVIEDEIKKVLNKIN
jgi:ribonuclease P protein component